MTRLLIAPAALTALVAIPWTLWPLAIFTVSVATAMGLGVWVWVLRRRLATMTALAAEAHVTATRAVEQAETFADELAAEQRRSNAADKAIVRLVAEKLRLSNDLLAAHKRISDAENVIPLPVVREASPYDWPVADGHFPVHTEVNDDDIEALMRATEEN
jgi:hypothetical protein